MGWDSDSDDAVDIDAQLAAKNAAKQTILDEEEARALKAAASKAQASAPKPKVAAPSVSSGTTVEVSSRTYDEDEITQSDPKLEKARMKRLQEKAELALMDDLFAGCEKPASAEEAGTTLVREVVRTIKEDSFEKLQLVTTKEVENLANRCGDKISASEVKSAGQKFMTELIRSIGHTLAVSDIAQLQKVLKELSTAKAREQAEKIAGKKKLSTDVAQLKKGAKIDVFDAMDEVYGDDYEEYDEAY
jgi:hypothetical protein